MNRQKAVSLHTEGIAHLYVGIAKVDGEISDAERNAAPFYAQKAQRIMDVMGLGPDIQKKIRATIDSVRIRYRDTTPAEHLDLAVSLISQAKDAGDWSTELIAARNADSLERVAQIDGYIYKESKYLSEIRSRLKEID